MEGVLAIRPALLPQVVQRAFELARSAQPMRIAPKARHVLPLLVSLAPTRVSAPPPDTRPVAFQAVARVQGCASESCWEISSSGNATSLALSILNALRERDARPQDEWAILGLRSVEKLVVLTLASTVAIRELAPTVSSSRCVRSVPRQAGEFAFPGRPTIDLATSPLKSSRSLVDPRTFTFQHRNPFRPVRIRSLRVSENWCDCAGKARGSGRLIGRVHGDELEGVVDAEVQNASSRQTSRASATSRSASCGQKSRLHRSQCFRETHNSPPSTRGAPGSSLSPAACTSGTALANPLRHAMSLNSTRGQKPTPRWCRRSRTSSTVHTEWAACARSSARGLNRRRLRAHSSSPSEAPPHRAWRAR